MGLTAHAVVLTRIAPVQYLQEFGELSVKDCMIAASEVNTNRPLLHITLVTCMTDLSLLLSILPEVCGHQHKKQVPPNQDRHCSNPCSNV